MPTVPTRDQVPTESTWNHESVFPSFDAWREEYQAAMAKLPEIDNFKGTLAQSPERLAEWFDFHQALARRVWTLFMYPVMWQACDGNNEANKGMVGQAQGLAGQFMAGAAFAEPELLALDGDRLQRWLRQDSLKLYQQHIDDLLRKKKHVLSGEVESVLGLLSDPLSRIESIRSALNDMDLKFEPANGGDGAPQPLVQSTVNKLLASSDRETRKQAWRNYADSYLNFQNTFTTTYLASVKRNVVLARAARAMRASCTPSSPQTTSRVEVFHNLIDTYKKHIPTWHRYWDVRRRALGYDTIHPWDIWAPLTADDPELTYPEAVEMIADGMAPLGENYVTTMRRGCLQERWVDYAINEGKSEGAFSFGTYDSFPFIMMSFDGNLSSMSTLAHELGHSMHSHYTRAHQPFVYSNYSMFAAEVASNFNQAMVRAHLFAGNSSRDFQLALIQEAMDNIHRYFFIMPTLARFELEVHTRMENDEPLTPEDAQRDHVRLLRRGLWRDDER